MSELQEGLLVFLCLRAKVVPRAELCSSSTSHMHSGGSRAPWRGGRSSFCCAKVPLLSLQWESRVTQYERDFERISAVIRKEVIRFEVRGQPLALTWAPAPPPGTAASLNPSMGELGSC